MDALVLAAESGLALMLVAAGAAKLADVSSFAATVQLFMPFEASVRSAVRTATAIATFELALGTASLAFPSVAVINFLVLATGCAFFAVSSIGYARHRGVSCRCFGQLSRRVFDVAGLARSFVVVGLAASVAGIAVSPSAIAITTVEHLLLLVAAGVVAFATYTAARGAALTNEAQPL